MNNIFAKRIINLFFVSSRPVSHWCPEKMQVLTQSKNPLTGSTEWVVQHEDYDYHQEIARSAFADMLHDTERNQKYFKALQLAIEKMHRDGKKANVLDIGTGTGLLSIMAAKCGADSIVACEAFKPMAECCLKILEKNNVADKITVIPKRSTELTVGENGDLKQKANILVTEVFDTELIGEGALSTFSHAHKYLLEEDCIVVPDSAVIYAQVVECPTLQKWNKLNDLADEDLQVILRTPQKMKSCPGSAAVHDLQLSQLARSSFQQLCEPIPVFYYDWSGRTPVHFQRMVKQKFSVNRTGKAQVVFMWWELNMDTEGKIVLSCAPWWSHPDADLTSERPQDTIPWRDHWMQAVYYLPKEVTLTKDTEVTLVSCQDEYSLWFYIEDETTVFKNYKRPICECGVHMSYSRTHVSYLNDGKRSKKFLSTLRESLNENSVVLDLNGSSFMGLAAAKMGAKMVYILESMNLNLAILNDYAKENSIENVKFISKADSEVLDEVTHVICDPNYSGAILPWENLKMVYFLNTFKRTVKLVPEACEFWAMPVEFQDMQKIRIPLKECEGIDMSIFDDLVESSRRISDDEFEAQPLWEYPCRCRGDPQRILHIDLSSVQDSYSGNQTCVFVDDSNTEEARKLNGFVVWAVWSVGGKQFSCGPQHSPRRGELLHWDPHTRQAVKILKNTIEVKNGDRWRYEVKCDLVKGKYEMKIDVISN